MSPPTSKLSIIIFAFLSIIIYTSAQDTPPAEATQTVYLIRHAEKPHDNDVGYTLTEAGIYRTKCLPGVFGPSSPHQVQALISPRMQGAGQGGRSYRTLIPTSESLNIPITALDKDHMTPQQVAEFIRALPAQRVLVSWEHKGLRDMALALGLTQEEAPKYKGTDYDTVWEIQDGGLKKWDQGCTMPGTNEEGLNFSSASGAVGGLAKIEVKTGWWVIAVWTVMMALLF